MMTGMLLGILTYRPIFNSFLEDSKIDTYKIESLGVIDQEAASRKSEPLKNGNGSIEIVSTKMSLPDGFQFTKTQIDTVFSSAQKSLQSKISYTNISLDNSTYWKFVGLVFLLILYVTMVYGPIAAFLVELFPTRIRYTSMSLPYHIGNGVFGGLVPFIGLLLTTTYPKDPLVGLWYPIGIAALCFIIGMIYLRNKIDKDVTD